MENGDPMHWPKGALVNMARGLLNMEAARVSYMKGQYNKALVEAQIASWDILRIPVEGARTPSHRAARCAHRVRRAGTHGLHGSGAN